MPSLFRFLTVVAVLGGLGYGIIYMLATWIDPKPREITVSVPPDRFVKQQ
jgi:phage shock protein PspC (stress-responsive transcriptional regulator)